MRRRWRDLEAKVGDCFLAGAVATGCDYHVEQTEPMYDALKPDDWMAEPSAPR